MKHIHHLLATLLLGLPLTSRAQVDLGSNGSYGALTITASTNLTVPEDGVFHCTTISITGTSPSGGGNVHVGFIKNNRNTPIYLLATGDVTIDARLYVDGSPNNGAFPGDAGPGGYSGGMASTGGQPPADGQGPGGGRAGINSSGDATQHGGSASYGSRSTVYEKNGPVYGNALLIPLVGGSGGGGAGDAHGGGGGGGAILIGSNTRITMQDDGRIYARGGNGGAYNHGSGGAIRLVAPDISIDYWSQYVTTEKYNEGPGRIRIDALRKQMPPGHGYFTGVVSSGSNMVVFPPNMPDLKIVEAAGQTVNPNQSTPVFITVPPGSSATQAVKVKAQNFGGTAAVVVTLTPEFGAKTSYTLDISNPGPDFAEASVNVTFPINVTTRVDVWTR
jgi:hypothetical protein